MKRRVPTLFLISALVTSLLFLPGIPRFKAPAAAQGLDTPQAAVEMMPDATLRTVDEMLLAQATATFPSVPGGVVVFRPGMDPAQYAAAKAAATAAASQGQRPASPAGPLAVVGPANCEGMDEFSATDINGGAWIPPDADGAVGDLYYGQTTNVHVTFWEKAVFVGGCPNLLTNPYFDIDLNSFMGYLPPAWPAATQLFDARIIHDNTFHRWVVTAEGFVESTGAQYQWIAVSTSDEPFDAWLMYVINTKGITGPACFWDYPQLGMSDTAILMTANIFGCAVGGRWLTMNKQWMYAGIGFPLCFWFGGVAELKNWAPPKVLGLPNSTWLIRAAPSGNALNLFQFFSPDAICAGTGFNGTVAVPAYGVPPNAPQPGTTIKLDTSDARFQNRSAQVEGYLWQTHTTNDFGFATPRLYRIRLSGIGAPVVEQTIDYFASGFSYDFNTSIAANSANTVAVVWSSTDPGAGVNAQVRVGAKTFAATGVSQALVFQSSVPLVGNGSPVARWGDYSSVAIDPAAGGRVWGVNERINNRNDPFGGSWGTQFFSATIP